MEKSLILFLLILFLTKLAEFRPSKSLNQQGGELEWEAWLLIQDNSRSSKVSDIKRITPKSIFTVRPFSPENLPPCAEGYRPDAMGRCVKVIKIDQNAHEGFLFEQLNMFYTEDDYADEVDSEEEKPVTGPLQFNIPFGENAESEVQKPENSTGNNNGSVTIPVSISEMISNLTTNSSVFSLIDEILQADQAPLVRDTEAANAMPFENVTTDSTNEVDSSSPTKTETIIILLHSLKNKERNATASKQINETKDSAVLEKEQSVVPQETELPSVVNETGLNLEIDDGIQKNITLQNITNSSAVVVEVPHNNETVVNVITNTTVTELTVAELPEKEEESEREVIPFAQNGDYKTAYFHTRYENMPTPTTTIQTTKPPQVQSVQTTTLQPIPKKDTISLTNDTRKSNHRNRDRTIFSWLTPNHTNSKYFTPTTSERTSNNKFYFTSSIRPFQHDGYRKSLRDSERRISTRRWSNR